MAGPADPAWRAYAAAFDDYMVATDTVGGAMVLMDHGVVSHRLVRGSADSEREQPVDRDTIFQYGSITKTLTAITILQLRDDGKLALDDPVVRYVPELRRISGPPGAVDRLTIRHLLAHTGGLQDATWPWTQGEPWQPFEPTEWSQLVAMMPYQRLAFEPGARFSYSNPAYIYLARVVEAVTGEPWLTYVDKNIFAPLAMERSYFSRTPRYLASSRANNYTWTTSNGGSELVANGREFDPGITNPNSGWNAPLEDLETYLAFLTGASRNDQERARFAYVLARSSLVEMWEGTVAIYEAVPPERMGLGFFVLTVNGHRIVGHSGSQAGFQAMLYFDPVERRGFAAVFNTAGKDPGRKRFYALRDAGLALIAAGK